jgi:arginyl-tRNA synthetase
LAFEYGLGTAFGDACLQAKDIVTGACTQLGSFPGLQVEVITPRERERGLLCTPVAFSLAKRLGASPIEIAQKIADGCNLALQDNENKQGLLTSAQAVLGYVNFSATPRFYCRAVEEAVSLSEDYGSADSLKGRKYVVEFSDPNVGKPFHIGHIRSTILGDSVSRLLAFQGAQVVRFNYLGDAGTQVAKLVVALEVFKDMPQATDEKGLLEYYTRIHKEIESNPELEQKAREVIEKIEAADPATLEVVNRIRQLSMNAFERNYKLLTVDFDEVTGESAFMAESRKRVDECLQKGIATREKDGSVVANLESNGLPNTILLRSNGTTLYLTRDLALADYKDGKYAFTHSVIFTASEQNMHFRQLQLILRLQGRQYWQSYEHVGFGLVFLQSGKLSSREGRIVFLEDVLNEAIAAGKTELAGRNLPYPREEVEQIATMVGIGGTKFSFLRVSSERNITFDPVKSTSFEGDTGSYVQYTCVRARNILRKLEGQTLSTTSPREFAWSAVEANLAQTISVFPSVVRSAAISYSPHVLCDYLLKLAADFSTFYEAKKVVEAESEDARNARALMVCACSLTLQNGLKLLGIMVPARM